MTIRRASHWADSECEVLIPRRRADVTEELLDNEAILVGPNNGCMYHLNDTATYVWHSCDGHTTTREIAAHLTARYDVDFEDALDYIGQLVVRFAELDLFEPGSEA